MSGGSYVPTFWSRRENPYTERVHRIYVRQAVPQKVLEDIAPSLSDIAKSCGYTVISNNAPTCLEISGNGDWLQVEKACRRFVRRGIPGRAVDHVTVVVRNADGTRELRDVGVNQVRRATLPSVQCKPNRRSYPGCGLYGPRPAGKRWQCQMTVHGKRLYLGMFDDMESAAHARDNYAIANNLHIPLNYPEEVAV